MGLKDSSVNKNRELSIAISSYVAIREKVILEEHKKLGVPWMVISHGHILKSLYLKGELTMSEVSKEIQKTPPTTTTLTKRLKKEGFINAKKVPEDCRKSVLSLTGKGVEHCRQMDSFFKDYKKAVDDGITTEEKEQALDVINKLVKNINKFDATRK